MPILTHPPLTFKAATSCLFCIMTRQLRKESATGIHHVMLRGINRQDILCRFISFSLNDTTYINYIKIRLFIGIMRDFNIHYTYIKHACNIHHTYIKLPSFSSLWARWRLVSDSLQSLKCRTEPCLLVGTLRVCEKFSREFESLLPVNSDFSATFLSNSRENFNVSPMVIWFKQ